MMKNPLRLLLVSLAVSVALLAGCSNDSATSDSTTTTAAGLSGNLNVFAAASLTSSFNAAKPVLIADNPGLALTLNYAGSNTLVTQITQGAEADVFASADQANMDKLVKAGLVDPPVTFARNRLEIAVAPGNPKGITGLADLAKPGLTVILEAEGVPAGDYTSKVLASSGITVVPKSLEADVKSAITKVTSGEADATVVYSTDTKAAGASVGSVAIPDAQQSGIQITYPIAVVKASKNFVAAKAFVDSAVSGKVHDQLIAAGFQNP